MTDDLQTLRTVLLPDEPDQDVIDRSRHRLRNRIGGFATRKRNRRLAVGTGLTVAVAAAAVVIAVVPGAPVDRPATGASAPAKPRTGKEFLLAAATAAERDPDRTGTFWYMKLTTEHSGPRTDMDVYETWTRPDGVQYWRGFKSGGRILKTPFILSRTPFSLPGAKLTLAQLRALPTDPQRLKTAITNAILHGDARNSAGPIRDQPEAVAYSELLSYMSLVSTLPAPPAVRAAALRAIAAYPGVRNLGPVPGGQGLLLPEGVRLVVDPETGRVNGTSVIVPMDGGENYPGYEDGTFSIRVEWTDTVPG